MDLHDVEHEVYVVAAVDEDGLLPSGAEMRAQLDRDYNISQALLHATLSGQHAPQLVYADWPPSTHPSPSVERFLKRLERGSSDPTIHERIARIRRQGWEKHDGSEA